jgi:hypothetical protein
MQRAIELAWSATAHVDTLIVQRLLLVFVAYVTLRTLKSVVNSAMNVAILALYVAVCAIIYQAVIQPSLFDDVPAVKQIDGAAAYLMNGVSSVARVVFAKIY